MLLTHRDSHTRECRGDSRRPTAQDRGHGVAANRATVTREIVAGFAGTRLAPVPRRKITTEVFSMTRRVTNQAIALALSVMAVAGCGTATGAALGAGSGAAISAGTGHSAGKGALVGAGVGAIGGAIYDVTRH
jgi:YmgG-like glycine-zipper protein